MPIGQNLVLNDLHSPGKLYAGEVVDTRIHELIHESGYKLELNVHRPEIESGRENWALR